MYKSFLAGFLTRSVLTHWCVSDHTHKTLLAGIKKIFTQSFAIKLCDFGVKSYTTTLFNDYCLLEGDDNNEGTMIFMAICLSQAFAC